ncbi:MAG: MerR family transcriptional regulator [Nitrospiraceae bacterium]|nr:MerR family transcriptional regulator [Nitrospiraceae bacterium]
MNKNEAIKKETVKNEISKKDLPLYTIGVVAELIGITDQTLRLYEKHGLIKPARRNRNRFFSDNDVKWLICIRDLIHNKKISIQGIKKLLDYAPCWEITDCPEEKRVKCTAFRNKAKPCWELSKTICNKSCSADGCQECVVYLSYNRAKN